MEVLVVVEDCKYQAIAEKIRENRQVKAELTNVDFNLTASITRCPIIIFFGAGETYADFCREYCSLLQDKLCLSTATYRDSNFAVEIEMKILLGLVLCKLPQLGAELEYVVSETLKTIFNGSLSVVESDESNYQPLIELVYTFESDVLALSHEMPLKAKAVETILKNIELNAIT